MRATPSITINKIQIQHNKKNLMKIGLKEISTYWKSPSNSGAIDMLNQVCSSFERIQILAFDGRLELLEVVDVF